MIEILVNVSDFFFHSGRFQKSKHTSYALTSGLGCQSIDFDVMEIADTSVNIRLSFTKIFRILLEKFSSMIQIRVYFRVDCEVECVFFGYGNVFKITAIHFDVVDEVGHRFVCLHRHTMRLIWSDLVLLQKLKQRHHFTEFCDNMCVEYFIRHSNILIQWHAHIMINFFRNLCQQISHFRRAVCVRFLGERILNKCTSRGYWSHSNTDFLSKSIWNHRLSLLNPK